MRKLKKTLSLFMLVGLSFTLVLSGCGQKKPIVIPDEDKPYVNKAPVVSHNEDIFVTQNQVNFDYKKELLVGLRIVDDNGTKAESDDVEIDVSQVTITEKQFRTMSIKKTVFNLSVDDPTDANLKTEFTRTIEVLAYDDYLAKKNIYSDSHNIASTKIFNIITNHMAKTGTKKNKAIVLGVDGMRSDALPLLSETLGMKRIAKTGGTYRAHNNGDENYTQVTVTGPSWTTMLTGVWANVHGVVDNATPKNSGVPTMMTQIAEKGYKTSFLSSWAEFKTLSLKGEENPNFTYLKPISDFKDKEDVIKRIEANDDFIFTVFGEVDTAGHSTGFATGNPKYMTAINKSNTYIEAIYQAIESRETYAEEDWLILVTTDHGGEFFMHGAQTKEESTIFIISNQPMSFEGLE